MNIQYTLTNPSNCAHWHVQVDEVDAEETVLAEHHFSWTLDEISSPNKHLDPGLERSAMENLDATIHNDNLTDFDLIKAAIEPFIWEI
jgi:hypothetical protein